MDMKLNQSVEDALAIKIAAGIQEMNPSDSYFSLQDFEWTRGLDQILSEDDRSKIMRYCSDHGLSGFIWHEIMADYASSSDRLVAGSAVTSISTFSNPIAYAQKLVRRLKSIPIRCRLTMKLPKVFSQPIIGEVPPVINLTDDVTVCIGSELPKPLPMATDNSIVNKDLFQHDFTGKQRSKDIESDRIYLSICLQGYATHKFASHITRSFEDSLKAFYGAGLAVGLVSHEWNWEIQEDDCPYILIHSESPRAIIATSDIEREITDASDYVSTEGFATKYRNEIWENYQLAMKSISAIFLNNVDCRKLYTACIWYYRATISRRPLDQMLESTIAIEVLLGDRSASEGVGLGNLLGNRCAFLLGESLKERQEILQLFSKIYSLRSLIVHEGKHKLEPGESRTVGAAVRLCGRIIAKELITRGIRN